MGRNVSSQNYAKAELSPSGKKLTLYFLEILRFIPDIFDVLICVVRGIITSYGTIIMVGLPTFKGLLPLLDLCFLLLTHLDFK